MYLEDKYGVKLVMNEDYSIYNNTSSIMRVLDRLEDTYICSSDTYICSSDNYFPSNVFINPVNIFSFIYSNTAFSDIHKHTKVIKLSFHVL